MSEQEGQKKQKIALGVEYLGTNYCGWQSQDHCLSVQECVQKALSSIANETIAVRCAGRTDTAVHAIGQVVHFETNAQRPDSAWIEGANTQLPHDIRIVWSRKVAEDFNARFSAVARQYRYVIFNRSVHSAVLTKRATWVRESLDVNAMNQAAQSLVGEKDFTSFRALACQASNAIRHLSSISVTRNGDFVFVDIQANAFLHHMVRNIVGSLLKIGKGHKKTDWIETLLLLKDRSKAGMTAPADGLYFVNAFYPDEYQIPRNELTELLWQT
jgi:tRNA pseudouridine38-40 synthase